MTKRGKKRKILKYVYEQMKKLFGHPERCVKTIKKT